MDRANEIRMQMKIKQQQTSTAATGFDALSGKEKAKYLKMLKEKKKQQESKGSRQPQSRPLPSAAATTRVEQKPVRVVAASQLSRPATSTISTAVDSGVQMSHNKSLLPPQAPPVSTASAGGGGTGGGLLGLSYGDSDADDDDDSDDTRGAAPVQGGVPEGFFDIPPSSSSSVLPVPPPSSSYSQPQALLHKEAPPVIVDETASKTGLPVGFFDDRAEDLEARGVDLREAAAKLAKHEDRQLEALLDEVDAVEEALQQEGAATGSGATLVEEYEQHLQQQESSESELMNAAVQLAYEARTAALLAKTEQSKRRKRERQCGLDDGAGQEPQPLQGLEGSVASEVGTLLQYMGSSTNGGASEDAAGGVVGVGGDDVAGGVCVSALDEMLAAGARKRKKKKDKKAAEEPYVPLDFTDWTSRGI